MFYLATGGREEDRFINPGHREVCGVKGYLVHKKPPPP